MTPADIPQELIDLLDARAGKAHSQQGSVVACLAEILTRYDEFLCAKAGLAGSGQTATRHDFDGHYSSSQCRVCGLAYDDWILIADEVSQELVRAHKKFPNQSLPWGGSPDGPVPKAKERKRTADLYRRLTDAKTKNGTVTWSDIIAEEFWEAYSEGDWKAARAELIQLAAMCFRTIADMDGKTSIWRDEDGATTSGR